MKKVVALFITFIFLFTTTIRVDAVPATSTKMHVTQAVRNSVDSIYMVLNNGNIVLMDGSGNDENVNGQASKTYTTADHGAYNHSEIAYFVVNGLRADYGVHYTWVNQDGETDSTYEAEGTGNYLLESLPDAPLLSVEKTVVEEEGSSVEKTVWEAGDTIWFKISISNPENFEFSSLKFSDILTGDDEVVIMADTSVSSHEFWINLTEDAVGNYTNEVVVDGYVEIVTTDQQSETIKVVTASDTADYEVVEPFVPDFGFSVLKEVVDGDESSTPKTDWLVGDTIWFKVTVTNEGNVPIDYFDYEDLLISDQVITIDESIAVDGSFSFWVSYPNAQVEDNLNEIDIMAYNDQYELSDEVSDDVSFDVDPIPEPPVEWVEDFSLVKRVVESEGNPLDKVTWYIDELITFEFTMTNTGNVPMDGFYFSDDMLEVEDEFMDVYLSGADSLSDEDEYTFHRTYEPSETGDFTNFVVIDGQYYQGELELTREAEVDFGVRNRPVTPPPSVVYYSVTAVSDPAGVADFTGTGSTFTFGSSFNVNYTNVTDGYTFIGWNLEPSGTITGNVALIASFELIEDEPVPEEPIPEEPIPEDPPVEPEVIIEEFPDEEIAEVILDEDIAEDLPDEDLPEAGGIPLAVNLVSGGMIAGLGGMIRRKRR